MFFHQPLGIPSEQCSQPLVDDDMELTTGEIMWNWVFDHATYGDIGQ
jgi:hypothetical protein